MLNLHYNPGNGSTLNPVVVYLIFYAFIVLQLAVIVYICVLTAKAVLGV
jgi:hypothetical protein